MKKKTAPVALLLIPTVCIGVVSAFPIEASAAVKEGVRTPGSRLPYIIGGIVCILIGVGAFLAMLQGHERTEVVMTPTGCLIPMPFIPLILFVAVGIGAFTIHPSDKFIQDGIRYSIDENSASVVGTVKDAQLPDILKLPEEVDGVPVTSVSGLKGKSFKKVVLPSSVTTIGKATFKDCQSLETVLYNGHGEISIGKDAFKNCTSLTNLVNFDQITSVGKCAFYECSSLGIIKLSATKKIGNSAFYGCTSLITSDVSAADEIGTGAFKNCTSLKELDIGSAEEIQSDTCKGCTSLQKVKLGSPGYIEGGAFADCPALKTVYLTHVNGRFSKNAFKGSDQTVIYCSNSSTVEKAEKAGLKTKSKP